MNSRSDPKPASESKNGDVSRINCSHQSTRVLLVLLMLVTVNLVGAYDWMIARLLKLLPHRRQRPLSPPVAIDFLRPDDSASAEDRKAS